MNEILCNIANSIIPISQLLPFIPAENRFQVYEMPVVRSIGKSMRDTLFSDPNPIPAFWSEYFARGDHLVTDALPHVNPDRLAHFSKMLLTPNNTPIGFVLPVRLVHRCQTDMSFEIRPRLWSVMERRTKMQAIPMRRKTFGKS